MAYIVKWPGGRNEMPERVYIFTSEKFWILIK